MYYNITERKEGVMKLLKNELGTVYYEVYGPENAPAVMFFHGVAMDHQSFKTQVEALKENYRVIVWDMPFHGKSSAIDKDISFSEASADFIMKIMDVLNISKAVMVGLSLGSFVIQKAAHKYPERVTALVHISGGTLYPKYNSLLKVLKPFMYLLKLYPDRLLNNAFAKHKALTKDTQDYLIETIQRTGKDVTIHMINEMLEDMVEGLPEHPKQPMLIIYGDHDISFIKNMSVKWHADRPESQLKMVENAHHIVNQDKPEELNKILLDFLKERQNVE